MFVSIFFLKACKYKKKPGVVWRYKYIWLESFQPNENKYMKEVLQHLYYKHPSS